MTNYAMVRLLSLGRWPAASSATAVWQQRHCSQQQQPPDKPPQADKSTPPQQQPSKLAVRSAKPALPGPAGPAGPSGPPTQHSRRLRWIRYLCGGSLLSVLLWAIYELGKPELDLHGLPLEDELSVLPLPQQYLQRMWRTLLYYHKLLNSPMPTMLLPNVRPPPYIQPHITLVLELKDVLVHPDWSYQTGWRFKKRPGVDYFLYQCSKHFEIVVYTAEQGMTVFPVLDALDPHGYISYRLVRGMTQCVNGRHIKNLQHLNRDLKRVIVVDWDRTATPYQPENVFGLVRWAGNDDDVQLFDLVAFLLIIAKHEVDDVREILHYYRQFEDPIERFKENQRKLLEQTQEKPDMEDTAPSVYQEWWTKFWNNTTVQR